MQNIKLRPRIQRKKKRNNPQKTPAWKKIYKEKIPQCFSLRDEYVLLKSVFLAYKPIERNTENISNCNKLIVTYASDLSFKL